MVFDELIGLSCMRPNFQSHPGQLDQTSSIWVKVGFSKDIKLKFGISILPGTLYEFIEFEMAILGI